VVALGENVATWKKKGKKSKCLELYVYNSCSLQTKTPLTAIFKYRRKVAKKPGKNCNALADAATTTTTTNRNHVII